MTGISFLTRLSHRAVIQITGVDSREFLQRIVTHGPQGVAPGRAMASALLTPQGKVLADLVFFDDGEGGLYVDVPASEADGLLKRFTLYRLRAKAELAIRADLAVAAASGEDEAGLEDVALALAPDPRAGALGMRAIVPAGPALADAPAAYLAAKADAIIAEMPLDYGPAECFSTDLNHDLLALIDYKKGCFVGQEVASRMHRKGGVRKRTVRISGEGAFTPGLAVTSGDMPLGEVLSGGRGFGLALLRIDRLEAASQPVMAGGSAVIIHRP